MSSCKGPEYSNSQDIAHQLWNNICTDAICNEHLYENIFDDKRRVNMFGEVKKAFADFGEAIKESLTSRKTKKRLADTEDSIEHLCDLSVSLSNRLAALERSVKKTKEVKNEKLKATSKNVREKTRGRSK